MTTPVLYNRAVDGTLTAADLEERSEINFIHPKSKLTPLGAAVWHGHVKQIKLLLEKGADPNGVAEGRPPLWVAASKTKVDPGRIVHILLKHGADPNQKSTVDGGSTPLLGAVKTYKSPAMISTLVDAGASPEEENDKHETAEQVATDRKDRERLQAMLPRAKRHSDRLPTLLALSGLMLGIVAWANGNVKTAGVAVAVGAAAGVATNAIKKRFHWSGWFDSPMFPERLQEPKPAEEFLEDMRKYIDGSHLDRFFPAGSNFLEEVAERAVRLDEEPDNTLNVRDLCRLALYQPYLYCDDSGSMKKDRRNEHQNQLVQRIASITTRLVPDDTGIELRFINAETSANMSRPTQDTIDSIMRGVVWNGWTEIGTHLRDRVLGDAVYSPLANDTFKRPVLVSIITDGDPCGPEGTKERPETLKDVIVECGQRLKENGYDPTVVRFQISQIGSDKKARDFLRALNSDPKLQDVLYCTAERLDDEFKHQRDNETRLEQWLLQLLMSPILNADRA